MQVYAPRDPLAEYLCGEITFRKLRVMVEAVPLDPSTPIGRVISGPWSDTDRLLHVVASVLKTLNASYYNLNRPKGSEASRPEQVPTPELTYYQRKAEKRRVLGSKHQRKSEAGLLAVLAENQKEANDGR